MIQLPKLLRDPKETERLCKCRPVCKSRRRKYKGELQKTSGELLIERKSPFECIQRWPMKVYPNSPCPLFGRKKGVISEEHNAIHNPRVVRLCQAPVDDTANTPYLRCAQMAVALGALGAVKACCAFCDCNACCACSIGSYKLHDAERKARRRSDMREFDARVKKDYQTMRIMYNKDKDNL